MVILTGILGRTMETASIRDREFAPYIGVSYDRRFGMTGDCARALGKDLEATSFVIAVRAWF